MRFPRLDTERFRQPEWWPFPEHPVSVGVFKACCVMWVAVIAAVVVFMICGLAVGIGKAVGLIPDHHSPKHDNPSTFVDPGGGNPTAGNPSSSPGGSDNSSDNGGDSGDSGGDGGDGGGGGGDGGD
jgi:hypothetical protein